MPIKIIVADRHEIVREGIKNIIKHRANDILLIGESSDGEGLLKLAKSKKADVYIIDLTMPAMDGFATMSLLLRKYPKSKVIVFTLRRSGEAVEKAMEYGAKGYILKDSTEDEIIKAIHEVSKGRFYVSSKISKYIVCGFLRNKGRMPESGRKVR